jgi:hypothetical protein
MHRTVRLDFTEHPLAPGYIVTLNGRPVRDGFATLSEVLIFARRLGTPARYAGTRLDRVIAEGGQLRNSDENVVG